MVRRRTPGFEGAGWRSLWLLLLGFCSWGSLEARGRTIVESFETAPSDRGWQSVGDSSLFVWEPGAESLRATWDSSRPNSYLALPLGRALTRKDDFRVALDLRPLSLAGGNDPDRPGPFEMAFGFLNLEQARGEGFVRGSGTESPNLVEWNYFPDTGFGATIASALVATNGHFESAFTFPLELEVGALYRIELIYTAARPSLQIVMTRDGISVGPIRELVMSPQFGDFRVDAFALSSYSGEGQDPSYPGSIYAQAQIDNLVIQVPDVFQFGVRGQWRNGAWNVDFQGVAGWSYLLQRSPDLRRWEPVGSAKEGHDAPLVFEDLRPDARNGFYRVMASAVATARPLGLDFQP